MSEVTRYYQKMSSNKTVRCLVLPIQKLTRTKNYSRADKIDLKFIRDSNSPLNRLTFQSPIIRELETIKYAHDTKGQSTGFAID